MSTSFNNLITEIGEIVRDTALSARTGREINNFLRKVNRLKEWSWNKVYTDFNLVAAQRDYSLPVNCKKVAALIGEFGRLSTLTPAKFFTSAELYEQTGNYVSTYTIPGRGMISFLPVPVTDKVIKIRYIRKFTELNSDVGDDPIDSYFPDDYKDVLVNYVVWMIMTSQNDKAQVTYRELFERGWIEMVKDDDPFPEEKTRLGQDTVRGSTGTDAYGLPKYGNIID